MPFKFIKNLQLLIISQILNLSKIDTEFCLPLLSSFMQCDFELNPGQTTKENF